MKIIQKQGLYLSIINYIGVVIGMASTIWLYNYDSKTYGLFRFLTDTANLIVPVAALGITYLGIKYFPQLRDDKKQHNGLLFMMLAVGIFGIGLTGLVLYLSYDWLLAKEFITKQADLDIKLPNLHYIYWYAVLILLFSIFRQYCSNFFKVALPTALDQLIKITFPILLIFHLWGTLTLNEVLMGVLLTFLFNLIAIIIYTQQTGQLYLKPTLSFLKIINWRELVLYGFYGAIGSGGTNIALRLETLFLGTHNTLKATGEFSIAAAMASVILVPMASIVSISSPIVTSAWERRDMAAIVRIYQKSSTNLLIVGILLFLGVWLNLDDLIHFIPRGDQMLFIHSVIFCVGMAKLFDLATGINDIITAYTKYFSFNFYTILLLAAFNLTLNKMLLPYGQLGVALSTMITSVLFNSLKLIFIYYKFKMWPFSVETVKLLALGLGLYGLLVLIPFNFLPFINILIRGSILCGLYGWVLIKWNISEDVTLIYKKGLKWLNF